MKIYTKTGDKGETSLFSGERISKFDERIDLYGTVDEMLAVITLALEFQPPATVTNDLKIICEKLFILSADFATKTESNKNSKIKRIAEKDVKNLENLIDNYSAELPALSSFIMPGGSKSSAFINLARTICRRAERLAVKLSTKETVNQFALLYLNRLSDYLFTAMRYSNN